MKNSVVRWCGVVGVMRQTKTFSASENILPKKQNRKVKTIAYAFTVFWIKF